MSSTGRKSEPPKPAEDKPKKPPAPARTSQDEDYEDGDISTPKDDRCGNDDEPL